MNENLIVLVGVIAIMLLLLIGINLGQIRAANLCKDKQMFVVYNQKYECNATGEWVE